ncbi:MAG: hypothetical protein GC151_10725 [Betaproteobacteria bacterium]|nr:hypothetical protein [Betaproteobacteria bacterium]
MPMDPTCRLPLPYQTPPRWVLRATLAAVLLAHTPANVPVHPLTVLMRQAQAVAPLPVWWIVGTLVGMHAP